VKGINAPTRVAWDIRSRHTRLRKKGVRQMRHRSRFVSLLAVLLLTLASCGGTPPNAIAPTPSATATQATYPISITDDRGKQITFNGPVARIVSVAPSSTEIVFALGAGDRAVAVDDFSDYPAEAKALPKVGGFKASPEKVLSFKPDLILATTTGDLAPALEAQAQRVVVFEPVDIDGVYKNIEALGAVLDRATAARDLVQRMRTRVSAVSERAKAAASKPRVLHEVDASDPTRIYVAGPGNFIDAMIGIAGGTNVAAATQSQYPQLSAEEIIRSNPEVIVLSDAAYGATPEVVSARPGWSAIDAVRKSRVYPIDPDIVSRPGPRLVDGIEAYAKLLHPDLFR
jgi:iron complex transport system substrate-binding protein